MHALLLSLALGQATPVAPTRSLQPLRALDFTRLPDGGFRAALDGQPVAGADFYRAVLRPDLAARTEEASAGRTALLIGAVVAPLAGLGIGWVAGSAQQWPLPPCVGAPPGPVSCVAHDQVAAQNHSAMQTSLLVGGAVGLATGLVLALAGSSIHPPEPTADEAEALVRAYRSRASVELEMAPGVARLAIRVGF